MIKWHYNERIFQFIDSPDKAYWLGFMYADGYLCSGNYSFGITLKESDVKHLCKFLDFLQLQEDKDGLLKYNENKSYTVILTRKSTYEDLQKIGFTTNKSYDTTLTVWSNIPDLYKKEFILGLWDGDGCFSITPSGTQLSNLISNNQFLILEIAKYIDEHYQKNFSTIHLPTPGDPYPRIRFTKNKAKLFGDWLYNNKSNYKLDRKYEQYQQMQTKSKAHFGFSNNKTKGILCIDTNKKYITAKECCLAEFGMDNPGAINNIRSVCRGERAQTRGKHFRYLTEEERQEWINEQ